LFLLCNTGLFETLKPLIFQTNRLKSTARNLWYHRSWEGSVFTDYFNL